MLKVGDSIPLETLTLGLFLPSSESEVPLANPGFWKVDERREDGWELQFSEVVT